MSHGVSYSLFSHSSIVNNKSHLVDIICALESYVPLEEEDVFISRKISNSLILVCFFISNIDRDVLGQMRTDRTKRKCV